MEDKETNAALTDKYREQRDQLESTINKYPPIKDKIKVHASPSGKYLLTITPLETGEGYWDYTVGEILNNVTGEKLFTIIRNYSHFWFKWIEHQNGKEYLLCGEDYQGYVTINLTDNKKYVFFPEVGFKGWGFCWIEVKDYNKDFDATIQVEGCHWGAPYEIVEFDFSNPDDLPYKEIKRWDVDYEDEDCDDCEDNEYGV